MWPDIKMHGHEQKDTIALYFTSAKSVPGKRPSTLFRPIVTIDDVRRQPTSHPVLKPEESLKGFKIRSLSIEQRQFGSHGSHETL
jgi:hypothetical protein